MSKTTFLYVLTDPITGTVRYLGKSDNPFKRLKGHLRDSAPSYKKNWIDSLKAVGQTPHMDLLDEVPTPQWEFWEREYIRVFKAIGINLTNATDGGDGLSGRVATPEQRAAQSARMKGIPQGPLSIEHRAAIRAAKIGVPLSPEHRAAMCGPKSPEHLAGMRRQLVALSVARTGVPLSPEHCAALSAARMGMKLSPEHRAAISAGHRGVPKSPEHRAALMGLTRSPGHCAAISKCQKGFSRGSYQRLKKLPLFSDGGGI